MANLLSPKRSREPFAELDSHQCERFASRLASLASEVASPDFFGRIARQLEFLEMPLAELDDDATLIAASEILDGIDRARHALVEMSGARTASSASAGESAASAPGGDLVCYWPGRSGSTGEADVASRGFFDVLDRPPVALWLEALARPIQSKADRFEIAIIVWIPPGQEGRAEAGCRACRDGSLAMLGEASEVLSRQLRPILLGPPAKRP